MEPGAELLSLEQSCSRVEAAWIRVIAAWNRVVAAWNRVEAAWIRVVAAWIRVVAAWNRVVVEVCRGWHCVCFVLSELGVFHLYALSFCSELWLVLRRIGYFACVPVCLSFCLCVSFCSELGVFRLCMPCHFALDLCLVLLRIGCVSLVYMVLLLSDLCFVLLFVYTPSRRTIFSGNQCSKPCTSRETQFVWIQMNSSFEFLWFVTVRVCVLIVWDTNLFCVGCCAIVASFSLFLAWNIRNWGNSGECPRTQAKFLSVLAWIRLG